MPCGGAFCVGWHTLRSAETASGPTESQESFLNGPCEDKPHGWGPPHLTVLDEHPHLHGIHVGTSAARFGFLVDPALV